MSNILNNLFDTEKTKIFLSRPNPFIEPQQQFIIRLQEELIKYDIETITLDADNYDLTDSMNYLK